MPDNHVLPSAEYQDTVSAPTLSSYSPSSSQMSRQPSSSPSSISTSENEAASAFAQRPLTRQYPIHVHILPVILPREPTLDELLVSGLTFL
jgi:hypothetical protein